MSVSEDPRICPKCLSNAHVREKTLLIGAASPRKIFGAAEERAGYQRKDQLAVDECKTEFLQEGPLQQFINGYYCEACGIGFVPNSIANGPIWPQSS
ncbi:hypothetical protein [Propionivibrio soli]|uniref:hypothetical protein n=1 Tax=Propionivibrio soli TaxID=2976531 RepID=UPI0021E92449|nr:hypothetical protein [Propionivibrio soli]